jgi:hypothetical protein
MGLDMYLNKKTYVKKWAHHDPEHQHSVTVKVGGKVRKDIKRDRISEITEEVMYWRKANHIHQWFVQNVQKGVDDCGDYYVEREQLEELLALCQEVGRTMDAGILPTQGGFFFGGTDYDDYYFEETKRTAKELKKLLAEPVPEKGYSGDFYYRSSW